MPKKKYFAGLNQRAGEAPFSSKKSFVCKPVSKMNGEKEFCFSWGTLAVPLPR